MQGPELTPAGRTEVLFQGRKLTFFAGNDYHRLSSEPEVVEALCEAARRYGISAAGSRVTTANHPLLLELEDALAGFLGAEAVALCASGYLSNTAAVQAVAPEVGRVLLEAEAHSSLVEAAAQSGLAVERFRSRDPDALAEALRRGARAAVLCDGVAPSTGDLAPLQEYVSLAERHGAPLIVDDAHGAGVLGERGRGTPEEAGVAGVIQTGTLSKAFGGSGGFVAGPDAVISELRRRSAAFIGATPMALPLAAAGLAALGVLHREPERLRVLRKRALALKERARDLGREPAEGAAPILSVAVASPNKLRSHLLDRGIYPPFIRYPGAPAGGHFRFTLSSRHSEEEVARLHDALRILPGLDSGAADI